MVDKMGKIKLFQFVLQGYQTMGIYPSQSNQNLLPNTKNVYFLLSMIRLFLSLIAFIVFEATSVNDFVKTFFASMITLCALVCFLITIWKIQQILMLIEHFEEFIGKRKYLRGNKGVIVKKKRF